MGSRLESALLLCLIAVVVTSFFSGIVGNNLRATDYIAIWNCINDQPGQMTEWGCEHYPPIIVYIGKFFVREEFFKQFLIIFFGLITPLILFFCTKNPITVFFYFTATNFYFDVLSSAYFAHAIAYSIIFSMYFLNNWQRLLILIFSIFSHSTSFYFALFFWFLILLKEKAFLKKFFLAVVPCSPFWGRKMPDVLATPVPSVHDYSLFNINSLFGVFLKRLPLPFIIFSIIGFLKEKKSFFLWLFVFFFFLGFFHQRFFSFASWPLIIGLTFYFEKADSKMKIILVLLCLANVFFNSFQVYSLYFYNC